MDEWSIAGELAVGLIIAAAFIGIAAVYVRLGQKMVNQRNEEATVAERVSEYRQYHGYDDKDIYAQDVVSLVFDQRGGLEVNLFDFSLSSQHDAPGAVDTIHGFRTTTTPTYRFVAGRIYKSGSLVADVDTAANWYTTERFIGTSSPILDIDKKYHVCLKKGDSGEVVGFYVWKIT